MPKQRSHGDGALYWDDKRSRWIVSVSVGYKSDGKRDVRRRSARTKTEARAKLREIFHEIEADTLAKAGPYTVADAVTYWLNNGLSGRSGQTAAMYRTYAATHIIPALGRRQLRELTVEDVEQLLSAKSKTLSTRSLRIIHSVLSRSVRHAQRRDRVRRNVVLLCEVPEGRAGRTSKSLTVDQAEAVLDAAEGTALHAYIVVSLLTGARTEEMRAVLWRDINLGGRPDAVPPVPPFMALQRSVRAGGDTKTRQSRRALALPQRCTTALAAQWDRRACAHADMAACGCLVFATRTGSPLDSHNVRRDFRKITARAGLAGREWTPRELRTSFVSLLSDADVPLERISRIVGHRSTTVTETIYRKQIRPVIEHGAEAMDMIFPESPA